MTLTPMTHQCRNRNLKWSSLYEEPDHNRVIGMVLIPGRGKISMMWDSKTGKALAHNFADISPESGYDLLPIKEEWVLMKRMAELIDRVMDDYSTDISMSLDRELQDCMNDYRDWELKTKA